MSDRNATRLVTSSRGGRVSLVRRVEPIEGPSKDQGEVSVVLKNVVSYSCVEESCPLHFDNPQEPQVEPIFAC